MIDNDWLVYAYQVEHLYHKYLWGEIGEERFRKGMEELIERMGLGSLVREERDLYRLAHDISVAFEYMMADLPLGKVVVGIAKGRSVVTGRVFEYKVLIKVY